MKRLFALTALLTSLAATADNSQLPGHYVLSGVPDVASEVVLNADGRFTWRIAANGMFEQSASGSWSADGAHVTLTNTHQGVPRFRLFTEQEYRYVHPAQDGAWTAVLSLPSLGPIPDAEVQFVAASGKTMSAVSPHNGYTVVKMPAGEQWRRVGLRMKGSTAPIQWLDVPSAQAAQRLAGFTVTNPDTVLPSPFDTLVLTRRGNELLMGPEQGGKGVYRKQ
ncbi:hypothetical protein [Duganella callida]|uniref:Uncharacterized protein n=1 Tax=Duganella callida TaxID=2561932 RepID=A0A4Y9SW87_9BURK|nr:hypothetical protein [Duganella callida]TFW29787.1 hypothetical protein E4L98_03310 [Duganella callida]